MLSVTEVLSGKLHFLASDAPGFFFRLGHSIIAYTRPTNWTIELTLAIPSRLLLGYMTMGSITAAIMISLGEMIAHLPLPGGHITLASRFVNPSFGAVLGWNYTYNWMLVLPAELNAAAVLIGYWNNTVK